MAETATLRFVRKGGVQLAALPPLALYVHLPWCLRKCPYCDFNSHAMTTSELHEQRYLDALRADLESALPSVWGRRVVSVFIGGGTPSLFSPDAIAALIADVRARLPLEPGCEITLEANPGTFERERFRAFRAAGVTRLSIGVQSFDDTKLAAIGRVHDAAQAHAAVSEAAAAFETFNIDLMYALPGQTLDELTADLNAALAYAPPHLSVYHLTIEPNTAFAVTPPPLPDDDTASTMLDRIVAATAGAGLERYEVSAFARPGHRCVHNLNYWRFGDYLGIGAGAHGKISFPDRIVRQVRWREPAMYMQRALEGRAVSSGSGSAGPLESPQETGRAGPALGAVSNEHEVRAAELPFEFMLNALRLREGFEERLFVERCGLGTEHLQPGLDTAVARGWLERSGTRIVPTPRGYDFLSDVQQLFLGARS